MNLALISMPWAIMNRPSVQLGALQAYLQHHCPDIKVTALHPYLNVAKEIGFDTYHLISKNTWAGEALFSALLYPQNIATSRSLFQSSLKPESKRLDFDNLTHVLSSQVDNWLATHDFSRFDLIGFSVCFSQLIPTLLAIKRIKALYPETTIVLGGSTCTPVIGKSLLKSFCDIDYIITREGEIPLLELCLHLSNNDPEVNLHHSAILSRHTLETPTPTSPLASNEAGDLNSLPPPHYDDYFGQIKALGLTFIPTLPIEFSRGCWWNKCAFCNLNLQWAGYRHKKWARMEKEVTYLSQRHRTLDFTFTDNALPIRDSRRFFSVMAEQQHDYQFFAEIRAGVAPSVYQLYKTGGLDFVQVGIESLSTSLLKRMNKGVRVIENIAAMKYCMEAGIQLDGNLILEFPGSTEKEMTQTLRALDAVLPFHPLDPAAFFLGSGSPVHCNPKSYGISALHHHPNYRKLFPDDVCSTLAPLIYSYRGDRMRQKELWRPVRKKMENWTQFHGARTNRTLPALSYRLGHNFLVIRQELPDAPTLHHRLAGKSCEIYLACMEIVTRKELLDAFKSINTNQISVFLDDLVHKNLLFQEDDLYLALAIHRGGR